MAKNANPPASEPGMTLDAAAQETLFALIKEAVIGGDAEQAMRLVKEALAKGVDPDDIVANALVESMSAVGRDFKSGEFYIPDVLMSSRASRSVAKTRLLSRSRRVFGKSPACRT